jgi:hypothetical protein
MSKESRKALADQSRIQAVFGEPERQSRWSVFFRGILLIPLAVVLLIRAIAVEFLVIIGWFCALVTGHLPARPASYIARSVQVQIRVQAYGSLMLDKYPPLSLDDHEYPVEVSFNPGRVARLSVLFRLILLIPAAIVENVVTGGFFIAAFFVWLVVLIRGKMPNNLFDALAAMLRYSARYMGYLLMVSSAYPGELFGDAVVVMSTPWPPAEGAGASYPPPSSWSGVPSPTPTDASTAQATQTPGAAYSGGPRYAFSQQDEPLPNAPFSATPPAPPPLKWGFDEPRPSVKARREPFVLSTEAKRILVLFIVLGVMFNGLSRAFPLVVIPHSIESTLQAEQAAEAIGFQPSDFPPGTQADYRGAGSVESRSTPALCTPISSQPWLADVYSGDYSLASNSAGAYAESTFSNVVVMPNATDATDGLNAIAAPGYAESCIKPGDDDDVPSSYTGSAACGSLSFLSSTIAPLDAPGLGIPAVAYRYTATMHCSSSGANFSVYDDTVDDVVGSAFIDGEFSEADTPPSPAQEQHYMSVMTARAPFDLTQGNAGIVALRANTARPSA